MLFLASQSQRRRQILSWLDIPFQTFTPTFDEASYKKTYAAKLGPEELSADLAYQKAKSASLQLQQGVILAADTEVYLDNQSLGKPKNLQEARQMLSKLSNREHLVITAVCVMQAESLDHRIEIEKSVVEFLPLTDQVIKTYLKKTGPTVLDRAGAYGIQDKNSRMLIANFHGSLSGIIGLPLQKTVDLLEEYGFIVEKDIKKLAIDKLGQPD
ncbi:MAG: septum formation protein Maf [bacterium]|nr:septum formation protein Maf [bacterium]